MRKEHWCIKDNCTHGTLNGSLELGSLFMAEWNKGYEQGYKDAIKDISNEVTIPARVRKNVEGKF